MAASIVPRKEDTRLERNKSGFFEIRWTEHAEGDRPRSRSHSCRTKDRREAEAIRDAWLSAGKLIEVRASAQDVENMARVYLELSGEKTDAQAWSLKSVRRLLGSKTLLDLNLATFADYTNTRRAEGRADGTIRRELGALSACLRWCRDHEVLPRDAVLPKIPLPAQGRARERYLDEAMATFVWNAAVQRVTAPPRPGERKDKWRAGLFVCLALETAARAQAIEGLTWDRVCLGARTIDFRDPAVRDTKKRRVVVPISDRLFNVLVAARQTVSTGAVVLGHKGSVRKAFESFVAGLGVETTRHDLRRTWATLRAQWGVSLFDVAGVLGDSIETVMKHYAHHSPDHLRGAVNARSPKAGMTP